jgi:hypothetical protein
MKIRVRKNFTSRDLMRDISVSPRTMREAGEQVAADIKQRTEQGRDAEGRAFARGATGEPVDLRATGQMLDDLVVTEVDAHRVRVGFRTERSAKLAELHEHGTSRMPARPFMRASAAAVARVVRLLKARIGR